MNSSQTLEDLGVIKLAEDVKGRSKGPREDGRILRDDGDSRSKVRQSDFRDVDSIQMDGSAGGFHETEEAESES